MFLDMDSPSILFVCTLRGARARIAELYAHKLGDPELRMASACFEPGAIRGLPVKITREIGMEFPEDLVSSVFQMFRTGQSFDHVVSMCDESGAELCDLFRRNVDVMYAKKSRRLSWDIGDFSALEGSEVELYAQAVQLRDRIGEQVRGLLAEIGSGTPV
jgi:arsenate reductase